MKRNNDAYKTAHAFGYVQVLKYNTCDKHWPNNSDDSTHINMEL